MGNFNIRLGILGLYGNQLLTMQKNPTNLHGGFSNWKFWCYFIVVYYKDYFEKLRRLLNYQQMTPILCKNLQEDNMQINFILFKVYIEPYRKWSNLKVKHDKPKKEYIIDYGYWRIFIY